jgi:hypothetical protein
VDIGHHRAFGSKSRFGLLRIHIYGDRLDYPAARTFVAISGSISLLCSSLCPSVQVFSRQCRDVIAPRQGSYLLDPHCVDDRISDEGFYVGRSAPTGDEKDPRMVRRSFPGQLGAGRRSRAQLVPGTSEAAGAGTALESQPPIPRTRELPDSPTFGLGKLKA